MKQPARISTQIVNGSGLKLPNGVELPVPQSIQATTILFDSVDDMLPISKDSLNQPTDRSNTCHYYGSIGTPTTDGLARSLSILEGGNQCALFPSGQAALHAVLATVAAPGDEILVVDCVTYTTRWLLDQVLSRNAIKVRYFPPADIDVLRASITPHTRAVLLESPGSMFYEIQDVSEIAAVCRSKGILTILDNTWSASTLFKGFETGHVDVIVLSLSKYHGAPTGTSGGAVITQDRALHAECKNFGALVGATMTSDAAARIALALPNLQIRVGHQCDSARKIIGAIRARAPSVAIYHPGSEPAGPAHLWRRDFLGSNSLFTLRLPANGSANAIDVARQLRVFRHGYGWGGDVSLVNVVRPNIERRYPIGGVEERFLRLYVGMEDAEDLARDLCDALAVNASCAALN